MTSVFFRSNPKNQEEDGAIGEQWQLALSRDTGICYDWTEFSEKIKSNPHNIVIGIDVITRGMGTISEFMFMLDTLVKYIAGPDAKPKIGVGIYRNTPLKVIKELQKFKIAGLVPHHAEFGIDETQSAIDAFYDNKSYWPKHIIQLLPGNEQSKPKKIETSLTERQQQVFDLIANRGLSNKQIARVLSISESTVKIHVSAVMKTLCVRNRTQLALTK